MLVREWYDFEMWYFRRDWNLQRGPQSRNPVAILDLFIRKWNALSLRHISMNTVCLCVDNDLCSRQALNAFGETPRPVVLALRVARLWGLF
jgi:hypothetical protein